MLFCPSFNQVKNSEKFKRIMQTILSLGNALNQGTARGAAVGFKLDSLPKLSETRARNNRMTLMHYLCKILAEKIPEVLDFTKELSSLEPATKVLHFHILHGFLLKLIRKLGTALIVLSEL
jgi:hypothetical protein